MSSSTPKPKIFLDELFIKNFRNITSLKLELSPGINLFIGQNGQGKTNILEAISLSCSLKPMQALQNIDLIRSEQDQAHIFANFLGLQDFKIEIEIHARGKKARIENKPLKSSSALSRNISLVSFIPSELNMILGTSSLRRRAVDLAAISLNFEHARILASYEKLLAHRNKILKDNFINKTSLFSFTKLLLEEGSKLIFSRINTLKQMRDFFKLELSKILGATHKAEIIYQMGDLNICAPNITDILATLNKAHEQKQNLEFIRKVTLFGPHLDDISFELDGLCAKKCASRGQTRALILAFKIAQMMAINNLRDSAPILILDDIISELDQEKQINLLKSIENLGLQAFFSATSLEFFSCIKAKAKVFNLTSAAA